MADRDALAPDVLRTLVAEFPAMVFVKEAAELRYVVWNREAELVTGLAAADVLGKNDHDAFPREQADAYAAVDRKVLATGEAASVESPVVGPAGQRWLLTRKVALRGVDGKATHVVGVSTDITDRRRSDAERERLNETLRDTLGQVVATEGLAAAGHAAVGTARELARALTTGAYEEALRLAGALSDAADVASLGHGACDLATALQPLAGRASLLNVEPVHVAIAADPLRKAVLALISFIVRRRGTAHEIASNVRDGVPEIEISAPGVKLTAIERAGLARIDADVALAARIVQVAGGSLTAEKRGAGTAFHLRLIPALG